MPLPISKKTIPARPAFMPKQVMQTRVEEEELTNEEEESFELTQEQMPVVKANYPSARRYQIFQAAEKPEDFEVFTSQSGCRIFGQQVSIDKYSLFLGSQQAQNELAKMKVPMQQSYSLQDIKELATIFTELAKLIEDK